MCHDNAVYEVRGRGTSQRALLYKATDRLELIRAGALTPLEQDRFGRRNHGSGGRHALQGRVPVECLAAADGIGSNVDAESMREQVVHRLLHADMCFDTRHNDAKSPFRIGR